jgi:hypothetical protein
MTTNFLRYFTKGILINEFYINNNFTKLVFFDDPTMDNPFLGYSTDRSVNNLKEWEKLYPGQDRNQSAQTDILTKIKNKIISSKNSIELHGNNQLIGYSKFAELAAYYENNIGWNLHPSVYNLGDDFLTDILEKVDVIPPTPPPHTMINYMEQ